MRANMMVTGAACALVLMACSSSFEGTPLDDDAKQEPTTQAGSGSDAGATCAAPVTPTDPSTLPKCACAKGGSARCVPRSRVPGSLGDKLDTCDSAGAPGACVPDDVVASGGAPPPQCKSKFGDGRCVDVCVPEVNKQMDLLDRGEGDVCKPDARCVPCINPLDKKPTGVCEIGETSGTACNAPTSSSSSSSTGDTQPASPAACPYTGPPVVDPSTFPSCGDGAHCTPANLVPATQASKLATCATGLCVPDKAIAAGGNYLPKTCKSIAAAEGRCTNVNIPAVAAQKDKLPRDLCDANERCAPCFDPVSGAATGACSSVSCDSPKNPPFKFKNCCNQSGTSRGKCVPTSSVPAAQQSKLNTDVCAEGQELCAPDEQLDPTYKAKTCSGSAPLIGSYTGACVSTCANVPAILSQGDCTTGFKCAPCTLLGQSTGACPGQ